VAVPPEHSFTRASDASPSWLGLPALAGCGSLPQSVWLRYSPSQLLMQAGRSDLCSRHQHGSAGHSACFVIRVTQLCRISQVRRRLARDAGLVALAAAHSSSDLQLTNTTWMTWVLGHAAWVCVCQIASQQLKRPSPTPVTRKIDPSRAVCVQLRAFRRHAERPGTPRSCRQVCSTWERRSVRACARRVYVSSE
jgi:hypothetical protein